MKAEILFVEDREEIDVPNQDQPEYRTENKKRLKRKKKEEEGEKWRRAR